MFEIYDIIKKKGSRNMTISSILSNIPFLKGLSGNSQNNTSINQSSRSEATIRRQAIEDTVSISPAASRSLESIDGSSNLSDGQVLEILDNTRLSLENNAELSLGADQNQAQSL